MGSPSRVERDGMFAWIDADNCRFLSVSDASAIARKWGSAPVRRQIAIAVSYKGLMDGARLIAAGKR
jgi:hypothetical protein